MTHHFWGGGALLLVGFSSLFWNYEELYKSSDIFLFLTGEEKLKRRNGPFLFPCLHCVLTERFVALTAGF